MHTAADFIMDSFATELCLRSDVIRLMGSDRRARPAIRRIHEFSQNCSQKNYMNRYFVIFTFDCYFYLILFHGMAVFALENV
jgi:hypothetical protein